jgi:NCS2 family nucleobase:cation symporter-2/xanthine permease XanP
MIMLSNTVLVVTISALGAGEDQSYLSWAVFAALLISGFTTALQASRIGQFGAGHILMMGAGSPFIAVSVLALTEGGPSMLASLIIASSLIQFVMARWLPRMRRIVTPVVRGTALMLIAISVIPIAIARLQDVPDGAPATAGLAAGTAAFVVFVTLSLRGTGVWRLWAIPIGIFAGCLVGAILGIYDFRPVIEAPWFDLPDFGSWAGVDLTFGPDFWGVLPMFVIVSLVVAVKYSSDGAVIQNVSRRRPRATDFRVVQGTLNIGGIGMVLSGLAGTPPPVIYTPSCLSLINLTGVATPGVGHTIGAMIVLVALLPKTLAIMLTVPGSVMGALLLIIMGLLFTEGMRTVVQSGLDHRKALVAGASLAIGAGLESHNIFADLVGGTWGVVLGNGLVSGVLSVVVLTSFLEVAGSRRRRLEVELDISSLLPISSFLRNLAIKNGWNSASTERLTAAGEETLSSMLELRDDYQEDKPPRLIVTVQGDPRTVDMEFITIGGEENIEDRLAYLVEHSNAPDENEISFRLLHHYASSVRHRKYHGIDVVKVQVTADPGARNTV